jgi:hypothetical protein
MYCKCGNIVPSERTQLGFNNCVNCSTTEKVGSVDIVYHKTGNTIEITDQATAAKIKKLSKRGSFGTMSCMKGSKTNTYNPKHTKFGASLSTIGTPESFERIGENCMMIYQGLGFNEAMKDLNKAIDGLEISKTQGNKIKIILEALEQSKIAEKPNEPLRYHNIDHKEEKIVDEEIDFTFKHWKRG